MKFTQDKKKKDFFFSSKQKKIPKNDYLFNWYLIRLHILVGKFIFCICYYILEQFVIILKLIYVLYSSHNIFWSINNTSEPYQLWHYLKQNTILRVPQESIRLIIIIIFSFWFLLLILPHLSLLLFNFFLLS